MRCSVSSWIRLLAAVAALRVADVVVVARDPNYAVEVDAVDYENQAVHSYRIVSLNWLNYLSSPSPTYDIYYKVLSVPKKLSLVTYPGSTTRFVRYDSNENAKKQLVSQVFEQVLNVYLVRLLDISKEVRLYADSVDREGVKLKGTGTETTDNGSLSRFNRTIVITFEDPPYGQSRSNRLVTNRNNEWTVWRSDLPGLRFKPGYNISRDLIYRYFHNLGHTLGFGHYIGSRSLDSSRKSTEFYRSVMYPNYRDFRFSENFATVGGLDQRAMRDIRKNYEKLVERNAEEFVHGPASMAFFYLIQMAARLA